MQLQIGPQSQSLGLAAKAGRAEAGAKGQILDPAGKGADHSVAHIFAFRIGRDGQTRRHQNRHVLDAVHRQIDAPVEKRLFDLLGEQGLAADFQKAAVLNPIAGGGDGGDGRNLVGVLWVGAQKPDNIGLGRSGLDHGEFRSPCADADRAGGGEGLGGRKAGRGMLHDDPAKATSSELASSYRRLQGPAMRRVAFF